VSKFFTIVKQDFKPAFLGADGLALVGDFSTFNIRKFMHQTRLLDNWNQESHKYEKLEFGKWRLVIEPTSDGKPV
jgi:hypothetical protein